MIIILECIAHRGYSSRAPENTMAAVNLALNTPGITGIEIDVQLTKDLVPVVIHDFVVDRVTNGKGFVKDFTYDQIRKLDAGNWFDSRYKGEKIPSFKEILQQVKGKNKLIIEIKSNGHEYPGIEKKVVDLIKEYDMVSEVFIKSFNHKIIKEISKIDASIQTGILITGHPTLLLEQVRETGSKFISMSYYYLDQEILEIMHSQGIDVMAWTVNIEYAVDHILKLDRDITIISDYPEKILSRDRRP